MIDRRSCPSGLVFNERSQQCDYATDEKCSRASAPANGTGILGFWSLTLLGLWLSLVKSQTFLNFSLFQTCLLAATDTSTARTLRTRTIVRSSTAACGTARCRWTARPAPSSTRISRSATGLRRCVSSPLVILVNSSLSRFLATPFR